MASVEQYEAFDQICREGLAYLSRVSQLLELEEQNTDQVSNTMISNEDQHADTSDEESTSERSFNSDDDHESVATSIMELMDYLSISDPFTTLFRKLERLAPKINSNELYEILQTIQVHIPQENVLSHLLALVRCSCPRTGQDTSQCQRCDNNICPSCSYNILDQCDVKDEISPDGRIWNRANSLAARRVKVFCEYEQVPAIFRREKDLCTCSSLFMQQEITSKMGQYCRICFESVILSLHRGENAIKKTSTLLMPNGQREALGIYWQYHCDCLFEPDEDETYCQLCFRKCIPYALNRTFQHGNSKQCQAGTNDEAFPNMIEQGERYLEEKQLWNTADCPYYFFPKERYYLVPINRIRSAEIGECKTVGQHNGNEEKGALEDQGLASGLLINLEGRDEEAAEAIMSTFEQDWWHGCDGVNFSPGREL